MTPKKSQERGAVAAPGNASRKLPIIAFANARAWSTWLTTHHATSRAGVWMKIAKKGSEFASVTYAEALEVALIWGWIDGQKGKFDGSWWLQRFTPRGPKSIWSKINREKAVALIASGRMKAAGLEAVAAAKKAGRWDAAYDSPKAAQVPEDFQEALDGNPRAREFFQALDGANRYAVLFRIQTVKRAETRARKIRDFVEMLERGEKIHEPRKSRPLSK
jgi:uncharacterized protein YdeI (YjbR/CyaY-like superfamily)